MTKGRGILFENSDLRFPLSPAKLKKEGVTALKKLDLPHYRCSVYLEGFTYRLSFRIHEGQRQTTAEVPHNHPQYELHAVFHGEITLEQEGVPPVSLRTGECCVVAPHVYHLRRLKTDDTQCCTLYIDGPKGAHLHGVHPGCTQLACTPVLMGYLQVLRQEIDSRQIGSDSSIRSLLTLLLITVIRELSSLPHHSTPGEKLSVAQQREETIDNFFASHYGQDVSAKDLADHLEITPRHLARVMQQRYGCTFRQHLLEIRLYHARQRLINSREPIWKIANDCGFVSQGAFATAFRKQVGCTPSQYRMEKALHN